MTVIPSDPDLAARIRAATALRRLGHAIVGHDQDPAVLGRIAEHAEQWLPAVEAGQPRSRSIETMKRDVFSMPAEGAPIGTFPDCVVSGEANPMGIDARFYRDGREAVCRLVFGPAFEGAPTRVHGGVVAAVFDDLMGFVLHIEESPAYTGELTVRYRAPTPVNTEIEFRGWLKERRGRKLRIEAVATHDGQRIATASALFVAIPHNRFERRD